MSRLLIRNAEVGGRRVRDVLLEGESITAIVPPCSDLLSRGRRAGIHRVIDARGGALLPGLRDHHIHLHALAAARQSIDCGPPAVRDAPGLAEALREADARLAPGTWLRGVAYHESVGGALDRAALDALLPDRPTRIQHRSGAMWLLNSAGLERIGLAGGECEGLPAGALRDARGVLDGRFLRLDAWLGQRIRETDGAGGFPPLAAVGAELARLGIVGVCDASASNDADALAALAAAQGSGALPQRLRVMGEDALPEHPSLARGALKLMLDDAALPDIAQLAERIRASHRRGREVAIHCVTAAELWVALHAIETAGPRPGDRIEHAGVAPPEAVEAIRRLSLLVVSQPHFIAERGDVYLEDVEARDRRWLYRGRGWLEAGVALAAGSDAPYGSPDPWAAMRAAVERKTAAGRVLGPNERLTPEEALSLFTGTLAAPGTASPLTPGADASDEPADWVGEVADLCLLDRPWAAARRSLRASHVRATLRGGDPIWLRPE